MSKISKARAAAFIADLKPKRRENAMFTAQASGVFACDDPTHVPNGRGGFTPGGFIDHVMGRKSATCNAADVLATLIADRVLTTDEVTARVATSASPNISAVLARVK